MPLLVFFLSLFGAGALFVSRSRAAWRVSDPIGYAGAGGEADRLTGPPAEAEADSEPVTPAAPAPAFHYQPILMAQASDLVGAIGGAARRIFVLPAAGAPFAELITRAEQQYGLPDSLLARLLMQESAFDYDIITGKRTSPAGALGIAQFMPATAREAGIDPLIPAQAIPAAAKYLRRLYDALGSDWALALAAYNWGIGNVQRQGIAKAPRETQNYMRQILADVDVA